MKEKKNTNPIPANFSFVLNLAETEEGYSGILFGRHYSRNSYGSWPKRIQMRYKLSIKKAFTDFFRTHRKFKPAALTKFYIFYYVHNVKSRDDDANYETLKAFRDCFTKNGLIADDTRQHILDTCEKEVLGPEYKIEFVFKKSP